MESGLYHIGYRYYAPEIGRFLSIDPIGFGVNWYVYGLNDPINLFEIEGLEAGKFDEFGDPFSKPHDWNWRCLNCLLGLKHPYEIIRGGPEEVPSNLYSQVYHQPFERATEIGTTVYLSASSLAFAAGMGGITVYRIVDEADNIFYVGITRRDLREREYEHRRGGKLTPDRNMKPLKRLKNLPDLDLARGVEQVFIDVYDPPRNKINSISRKNPRYKELMERALKFLQKKGYGWLVKMFRATNILSH